MTSYAYDPAEKPQPVPSAPPLQGESPVQRQHSEQYGYPAPPPRETSASHLYAQPVAYSQQTPLMAPPSMAAVPHMQVMQPQATGSFYGHPKVQRARSIQRQWSNLSDDDSSFHSIVVETGRLAIFHGLNSVLGYVAFALCVGGVAMSVGLLPLCCFGIVVFRLVLYAVYGFAQLDVMLFNYITAPEDHIYVQVPQNPRAQSLTGQRLAPSLSSFSPLSLMALIYFCTIKFVLSTLSTICFSLVVTAPLSLLCAALGINHGKFFELQFGPEDVANFQSDPMPFIVATICLFVIGIALMHLVAKASREATRFFCCERFSTYRYVHQPSMHTQFLEATGPAYGSTTGAVPTATYSGSS